ncbi:hypothetical protein JCM8208_007865 [Rhodotorula glutinis]
MELLTDSETRDFSRFLDSFASSSSGPPPSSTSTAVASASSALGFAAPPPPPQAVGSSSRRTLAHGGAATWDFGGWADSAGQHHAPRLPHPPPPPPPLLSHRSSSGSSVPLAHRPHGYATASAAPLASLPRPPHLSYDTSTSHLPVPPSLAPHFQHLHPGDAAHAEPDASKRARMAQHARDLEAWMGRAPSRPPPGAAGDEDEDEDEGGREERGLPPLKRARSEDPGSSRGRRTGSGRETSRARRGRGGEDPLVAMLEEAERRAGWPGAAAVAGAGAAAREPARALLHAAATAAAVQQEEDEGVREPEWPAVLSPGKRRPAQAAAQASGPGRKKRAAADAPVVADAPAPGPSGSPRLVAPTSRAKGGAKKKNASSGAATTVDDTPMDDNNTSSGASPAPVLPVPPSSLIDNDDPDAPHHNPGPLVTPTNIPRLPARPRRLLGPSRASSTPSESPAPAQAGGGANKGALLTAEQKKANHIASEQKRRAAIRQGYDGLCEVVPALRAAVQEFEERVRKVTSGAAAAGGAGGGEAAGADGALEGTKGGKGKKRLGRGLDGQSTTGALMGGIQVGGEKIDGRAGPKSEAVVLGKTVERVRYLLSQRSTLLSRLSDAYALSAQHGLDVAPAAGSFGSEWDEKWDESMRAEVLGAGIRDEAADQYGDEDAPGEWDGA